MSLKKGKWCVTYIPLEKNVHFALKVMAENNDRTLSKQINALLRPIANEYLEKNKLEPAL